MHQNTDGNGKNIQIQNDQKKMKQQYSDSLKGSPLSPELSPVWKESSSKEEDQKTKARNGPLIIVRFFYDGAPISQGRLITFTPGEHETDFGADGLDNTQGQDRVKKLHAHEIIQVLKKDGGVDFDKFFASVYEMDVTGGGWLPIQKRDASSNNDVLPISFPLSNYNCDENSETKYHRVDVKIFRRPIKMLKGDDHKIIEWTRDKALADADAQLKGKLKDSSTGYFGIGIVNAKTSENVGTLWRSSYQLGASFIYTIGARYKKNRNSSSSDTTQTPSQIPLFEFDQWSDFIQNAPNGAKWVVIEMGGIPLRDYEHPKNAIYILGSEDSGVPKSILRSAHEVVSLDCERYSSYNVAVAGSLVLYDRMEKMRRNNYDIDDSAF